MLRFPLVALALLVAADVSAQIQLEARAMQREPIIMVGPATPLPTITGTTGDRVVSLVTPRYGIPYRIEIGEKRDDACYMLIYNYFPVDIPTSDDDRYLRFSECGLGGVTRRSRRTVETSGTERGIPHFGAIYAIQLGDNNRRPNRLKMKGLRIYETTLDADGEGGVVRRKDLMHEASRTNTRRWHPAAVCPDNQIIVGLDLHINDTVYSIVGIRPHCATVTVEERFVPLSR
ncbi:MAG: hypothetical protein AAF170_12755 [Bacteroidota bacterium]